MAREKLSFARKSYGFRLDVELVKRLKIVAVKEGEAVNEVMEAAIREFLKKDEKDIRECLNKYKKPR